MTSTLLDISGRLDPRTVALYEAVNQVASGLTIPFVVVGASARDMVLHYGYGADLHRATVDVDFGIQVQDWHAFENLRAELIKVNFAPTKTYHRLKNPGGLQVDIVPFGGVEDEAANIHWPPDGETVMSVLGFQEAYAHADIVRIQARPEVTVKVASPEGMVLLKLIAWLDRAPDVRRKDADDLAYLLRQYERIPSVRDKAFERTDVMDRYGWDLTMAAACILGEAARTIATDRTAARIYSLFEGKDGSLTAESLLEDMCQSSKVAYEANQALLSAFRDGFVR